LENWRRADAADRRTKLDRDGRIRKLVDEDFSGRSITLAVDNPDTHGVASLFEACPQEEARRINIVFAPRHGSWPDMAEIEIGVISR
ncbi:MAG: IS630 family transposase, partial [Candidatus Poribacteria bacterium]|nr:IS630 family transposase [Candidatus Poribacteria bacterium]